MQAQPMKQARPVQQRRSNEPIQPQRHGKAHMHSQGNGMIPNFIPTCHFCGTDSHIKPNCFHYIKMHRVKNMIEKKRSRAKIHVPRKSRTNLHDPMTSRAHVPMITRKENVSPRWIRRDEYFCHVAQIALTANSSNFWNENCYCLEARVVSCNVSKNEQIELWHKKLGHMNYRDLRILDKFNVVRGLPKLGKKVNGVCGPCQQRKQTKSMHKKGKFLSTKEPLELLHMDVKGPMQTESLGGKRSDHGREFENACFESYCNSLGISHGFSAPRTPQQNGGRKPNVSYFHSFGSKCYILNDHDQLGKFDAMSDDGIFIGYALNNRAYRVFNLKTQSVMESSNVVIDYNRLKTSNHEEEVVVVDDSPFEKVVETPTDRRSNLNEKNTQLLDRVPLLDSNEPASWVRKLHDKNDIIGEVNESVKTMCQIANLNSYTCYTSQIEHKKADKALKDEYWVLAMQEELKRFERSEV
ncbi:hypothetical protein Q3G72_027164 [Acer saccharum]|nr:hypothetical protein Q3G72_027164 [Acer saccharum]